jgi:hypothetical protein
MNVIEDETEWWMIVVVWSSGVVTDLLVPLE